MTENIKKQEKLRDFVREYVYANQTMLIVELLEKEIVSYDEIENLYTKENWCDKCKKDVEIKENGYCKECGWEVEPEPQEIYEWWLVNNWLLDRLEKKSEPILRSDYENWWGRCTTGQAILLDGVIEEIYDDLHKNECPHSNCDDDAKCIKCGEQQ